MQVDRGNRVGMLAATDMLVSLSDSALRFLKQAADLVALDTGATLIHQGDTADCLYLIASGWLRMVDGPEPGRVLAELGAGQTVGELDLFTSERRSARVVATTPCELLKVSRDAFDRLAEEFPEQMERVVQAVAERLRRSHVSFSLRHSVLFEGLGEEALRDLESELALVSRGGGEVLFRQGEPGDCLYLVISGRLRVVVAVLSGEPRSATVYAIRDAQLPRPLKTAFEHLLARYPLGMTKAFTCRVVDRLREQISVSTRVPNTLVSVVVLAVNSEARIDEFCRRLAQALGEIAPTIHVTSARVDECLQKRGAASATEQGLDNVRVVEFLNRLETEYRYVIYETDGGASPWTLRSLRQADYVVVVGAGYTSPAGADAEVLRLLREKTNAPRHLVLVYRDRNRQPARTAEWLDLLQPSRHHHVVHTDEADYARVARYITGRAVGLVLGGGFARGMAHAYPLILPAEPALAESLPRSARKPGISTAWQRRRAQAAKPHSRTSRCRWSHCCLENGTARGSMVFRATG